MVTGRLEFIDKFLKSFNAWDMNTAQGEDY